MEALRLTPETAWWHRMPLASEWVLLVGRRGLCDEARFDALQAQSLDFDLAASCGLAYACGSQPLAAGDESTFGARAFAASDRVTVAFWPPARRHQSWYALTGGALLCRTDLFRSLKPPSAERAMDCTILELSRQAAIVGARCRVVAELLAVEDALPEDRLPASAFPMMAPSVRLARGVRASFASRELATAVAWASALSVRSQSQ